MQLNDLKPKTPLKKSKRIGRGGSRGKTSGRGHKGQRSRAGHSIRPQARDEIKRIPKKRGYKFSSIKPKPFTINVSTIEEKFVSGEDVSMATLKEKGILKNKSDKSVKVLGNGDITKAVKVIGCDVSESAREKIESVGGTVN